MPEPAWWFNITPSSWAFLPGKRTNRAGLEDALSGGEEFPVVVPSVGEGGWLQSAKVAEKGVCGVWSVLWGADQGPACSVLEIWMVLGPNIFWRQKLSRHLDRDAKDFFFRVKESKMFSNSACAQPLVPLALTSFVRHWWEGCRKTTVPIPPTLCKETGLCSSPSG